MRGLEGETMPPADPGVVAGWRQHKRAGWRQHKRLEADRVGRDMHMLGELGAR